MFWALQVCFITCPLSQCYRAVSIRWNDAVYFFFIKDFEAVSCPTLTGILNCGGGFQINNSKSSWFITAMGA